MMMNHGEVNAAATKPPIGRRMKSRAPPAPPRVPEPAPRKIFRNAVPDGGGPGLGGGGGADSKENNVPSSTVDLHLTTPQGHQTRITEDGSKALMDLLVEQCSLYHLNPALHTLELLSAEGVPLGFKPNVLLGSLDVARVLIREKVWEEKVVRRPAPKVPEKTVRLVVNYHRTQKAVVRVNPLAPLRSLIPAVCEKCEFDPAHVLLLKDGFSDHELPLDRSLTQLGLKELYALDQSLDSIRSSSTSVSGAEKKGLLGIFRFNRRKSKTEEAAVDMEVTADNLITQNTDTHSNGLSTSSMTGPCVEARPSTLGQSQSVMNISRISPKTEPKKRRAPAPPGCPTPTLDHYSLGSYQLGLGSESQQRKRKAPAPPPTPTSVTPGLDSTSDPSATPSPAETPTPTPACRTKVAQSTSVTVAHVALRPKARQQSPVSPAPPAVTVATGPVAPPSSSGASPAPSSPAPSSPAPSSSTSTGENSLALQDSSSEFSHNMDDSDTDLEAAPGTFYSTSSCSGSTLEEAPPPGTTSSASSTPTRSATARSATPSSATPRSTTPCSRMEDSSEQPGATSVAPSYQTETETESALNLRMEEVESNRHSAVAWLHSQRSSVPGGQTPHAERPEEETLSVGSSSGGSSLPDQGYAPSEGTAEGEDSCAVSSPSDTTPTSPDGSLSLDGGGGRGGGRQPGPVRENSSDSDEGCATWGSRHSDVTSKEKSGRSKGSYEEDPELTAQLNRTLAEFEADLADMSHVEVSERSYTYRDLDQVPVSVVDIMDVPVTSIDDVLEDDEGRTTTDHQVASAQPAASRGPGLSRQAGGGEVQNRNNNASTTQSSRKSGTDDGSQQPRGAAQRRASLEDKPPSGAATEEERRTTGGSKPANDAEAERKQAVVTSKPRERDGAEARRVVVSVKRDAVAVPGKKLNLSSQRSASAEEDEVPVYRVQSAGASGSSSSHSKITRSPTSRFGMKTFTVVPPKPCLSHAAAAAEEDKAAVTLTVGAIRIDEFGDMVKAGIARNRFGGSFESGINNHAGEASPLLEKAKAFWSSTERQDGPLSIAGGGGRGSTEKDNSRSAHSALSETTTGNANKTESLKVTQVAACDPSEKATPREMVKESGKEVLEVTKEERLEVETKVLVSEPTHLPGSKPPPLLQDQRRDLSFLKPSRRTSSHYVASAISKYTPKTSAKPDGIPSIHESSAPLKTGNFSYQRGGRSILVNPHHSSQASVSGSKETSSGSESHPSGPKRSMSFPDYISETQTDPEEVRRDKGDYVSRYRSIGGSSKSLSADTNNTKHLRPSSPVRLHVTTTDHSADIKHTRPRSPSPSKATTVQSPPPLSHAKQVSASKTSNKETTTKAAVVRPALARKPEPSVRVSAGGGGVLPEPQQVTVFGPVTRFRPVICKSVQKETNVHSSLMQAIQTGGGKERLKKISSCAPSLKKPSYAEEENERSALLAAIRAQSSSSGRLRKTGSEASEELQRSRKSSGQEESSSGASPPPGTPSPPSLPCSSPPPPRCPPACAPPLPLPPPPMGPPPPPPPAQARPSVVAHGGAQVDAGGAREAMLEAIRSGSAVRELKKVAAPTKTVQVNGRLGTIQASSSSTLAQQ